MAEKLANARPKPEPCPWDDCLYPDCIGQMGTCPDYFPEQDCPGHIAKRNDPKVCMLCNTHIDSMLPDGEEE